MYDKITNPITGRNVDIKSNLGKQILKNYLNMIGGSNSKFRRAVGVVRASNRFKSGGLRYIERKINNLVDSKIIEYNINNGYASIDLNKLDIRNCPEYINYVNDLIDEYNKNSFLKNDILAIMSGLTNMNCVGKDLKINKINRDDRNDWGFFVAIGILILKINVDKYKNLCNLVRKGVGLGYTIVSNSINQSGGSNARRKFKSAVIAVKLSSSMLKDIRLREQGLKNTVNLMVNNNVEVDREKSSMDISKSNILLNGAEELINLEDKNKNKRIVGLLNLLKIDCVLSGGSMSQSATRGLISGALGAVTAATVLAFAPCFTTGYGLGVLAVNATVGTCATGVLTGGGYTTFAIVGAGLGSAVNTYLTTRIRGPGSGNNTGEEMEIPENIVLTKLNKVLEIVKRDAQAWLNENPDPPVLRDRLKKYNTQLAYCKGIINKDKSKSDELVTMFESRKSWKHGENSGLRKFLLKYTGLKDAVTGVDAAPDDDTAILPAITYNANKVDNHEFTGLKRGKSLNHPITGRNELTDNRLGWELNYNWPELWCGDTQTKPPSDCDYPSHILKLAEPNNIISRYARMNGDFTFDDTTGKWIDGDTKEEIILDEDDGEIDEYNKDLRRETDKDRIFLAPEIIKEVNSWYSLSDREKQHTLPPLYFIVCKGEKMYRMEALVNPALEILGATPFKSKWGLPDVGHLSCIFIVNKKAYSFGLGFGAPEDVTIGGHPRLRALVKKLGGEYSETKFDIEQLGGSIAAAVKEGKEQLHHNLMAALYTPDYVIEPTRRTSKGQTFDYKIVDMGILSKEFANNINDYIKQNAINMGYNQDDTEDSSSHSLIGYFVYMNLIYEEFSRKKDNDGKHHCASFLENMFPGKIACDLPPFSLDKRTVGTGIATTLGAIGLGGLFGTLALLVGVSSATLLLIAQGSAATSVAGYHAAIAKLLSKKGIKAMRVLYGFSAPWHCKRIKGQYTPKDVNAIWNLMEGMRLGEAAGEMRDICIENRFGEKLEKILNGPGGYFKYKNKDVAIEQPAMEAPNTGWFSTAAPDEPKPKPRQRVRPSVRNVEESELKALSFAELKTKAGELSLTNEVIGKYGSRTKKDTYIAAIMASNK